MIRMVKALTVVFALAMPGIANAATATFDFTKEARSASVAGQRYIKDGVSLHVTSAMYNGLFAFHMGAVGQIYNNGLFTRVRAGDIDYVDGYRENDVAVFNFDQEVHIDRIILNSFNNDNFSEAITKPESFAFFSDSDGDGKVELRDQTLKQRNYEFPNTAMTYGTVFGIGSLFEGTEFYIDSITVTTVSAVPLPPAALLFGGAVMGLGWITRRRKAAKPS